VAEGSFFGTALELILDVEVVLDRDSKEPATTEVLDVLEVAKERGLLLEKDGLSSHTLRIKSPMRITTADVDFFVDCLDEVLSILGIQNCGE